MPIVIGILIGLFIVSVLVGNGDRTERDYYKLKDSCKGLIGTEEDDRGEELKFVCVGGN